MADRSISISLEARVAGFVSGLRTAQQAATDFADRTATFARENEQHLDRVGKASMVFGGALLAGVGIAVKAFMDFDAAMSEVQASTHETTANMDLLREAAINAGADTAFSAGEAAKGIDELAKAGVSTKDILGGGLTGALSLAAAGSLGVGDAAEIAATALTQFKLSGDKVPHLADLLAAGAGKAQGSVQDMGMALKQAGLVAASTGLSIEETTGGLAAFASAGLIGSDAGTSFKSMLQRLTPQSLEAKKEMEKLGISAYDAQGNFVGLSKFSENLKTSMKDLTPEARNAAMGIIFGSDAVRAANVLYEQGGAGISDWTDKVNDAGFAAVTASIKQDNLAGDIEKLGGSFDSLLIKSGGGLAESLRGIVQGIEGMVDAFGKIPAPILNAGLGIMGIVGAAALLGGALMTALPKIMEFRASMAVLGGPTGAPRVASAIGAVAKSAGVALIALVALQAASAVFTEKHTKSAEDYGQALLKVGKSAGSIDGSGLDALFNGGFDKFFGQDIVVGINGTADAIQRLTHQTPGDGFNKAVEGFTSFLGMPKHDISQLEDRLKGLGDEMGNLAKSGAGETAAKTFQALTKEFEKNGKGAKEALDALPGYKDALKGLGVQAGVVLEGQDLLDFAMGKIPASMAAAKGAVETYTTKAGLAKPVTEDMAKALEAVGLSAEGAITDIDAFGKSLFAAGLLSLSASDASIAYQDAIDKMTASVTKNGTTLDINTEAGRANQSAFNDIAKAAITSAEASAKETLATEGSAAAQAQLQGSLGQSYKDLIIAAGQLDITGDAADTLARKALGVPKNVNLDAWIADHASSTLDGIKGKAEALDGKKVTITIDTIATKFEQVVGLPAQVSDGSAGQGAGVYAPGFIPRRASGGDLDSAPGPKGVDSRLFYGAKGEHVLSDSDVDAMGGQAAVYAFRKQLHSGVRAGFQYAPASAPARQSTAPMDAGRSSGTVNYNTTINQVDDPIGTSHAVARRQQAIAT